MGVFVFLQMFNSLDLLFLLLGLLLLAAGIWLLYSLGLALIVLGGSLAGIEVLFTVVDKLRAR